MTRSRALVLSTGETVAELQKLAEALRKADLPAPARIYVIEFPAPLAAATRPQAQRAAQMQAQHQVERSAQLAGLMEGWDGVFGDRGATAKQAIEYAWTLSSDEAKRLGLALRGIARERGAPLTPKIIGQFLRQHERVQVNGRCFARCGELDHTILWRLRVKPG